MSSILLIAIYVAFIGLGIPDSLFGTALPAIHADFDIPLTAASYVTCIVFTGTIISSLFSARLINRFGTAAVTAVSTALTAAALLGFSLSGNMLHFCLCSVPLGIGAGAIDSGLNNYVALHYKATHMNFLHCFYGIGISLSPYLMSLAFSGSSGWRGGYRLAFTFQLAITVVMFISLPLWKRASPTGVCEKREAESKSLGIFSLFRVSNLPAVWLAFIGSCAVECTCGTWGSTFLVDFKNMSIETAARMMIFYYIGIAFGRFISGFLAKKLSSWQIIGIGSSVLTIAVVILFLPLSTAFAGAALFLVGLGNGPIFPNLTQLTPVSFGRDISQSVMGSQLAFAYTGGMVAPAIFSVFAENIGLSAFPFYIAAMFALLVLSLITAYRGLKKARRTG